MPTMLWILPLLAIVAAESGFDSGYGLFEQRSFEFATEKPIFVNANIQDFVLSAMENNIAIKMTHNCSSPLPISLQKCRRTFLYSTSETSYRSLIFQDNWLPYLLKVTQLRCREDAPDDQSITILVAAMEKTSCRVVFRYAPRTTDYAKVRHAKTAFDINQSQVHQTAHKAQIDLDALVKNNQVDVVTSIRKPFDIYLAKCDFVAPYRIRTGRNLTDNEDQVELIIRMAQLICPEDRSSSFDLYISSQTRIYGDLHFEVAGTGTVTSFSFRQFFLVGLFALVIVSTLVVAASYNTCLNCNALADDDDAEDGHWDENVEQGTDRVEPVVERSLAKHITVDDGVWC